MNAEAVPDGIREAARHGSYCPKMCNFSCPVLTATGREGAAPWALHRTVAAVLDGERAPDVDAYGALRGCTGCHACRRACLYDLDVPAEVRAARRVVVADEAPPAVAAVVEAVAAGRTPYEDAGAGGEVAAFDGSFAASAAVGGDPTVDGAGQAVALVAGCADDRESVSAAERLLSAAGLEVRTVRPHGCCGGLLDDLGASGAAEEARDRLAGDLPADTDRVVTTDPHCLASLRGIADGRAVRHVVEELASALSEERLDLGVGDSAPAEVTIHDPCVLARDHRVVTSPRRLLAAAGTTVVEPEGSGQATVCAGAGMGFDLIDPDAAEAVAARRASLLPEVPTVTACARARQRLAAVGVDVVDLATLLEQHLPGAP